MTQLGTDTQTPAPRLSDLNEHERNRLFARVQERLPAVWDAMRLDLEDESVVVVPSVTLDRTSPGSGSLGRRSRNGSCSSCCCSGNRGCA